MSRPSSYKFYIDQIGTFLLAVQGRLFEMGEGDRLYFQLVNQLNMECTLARIYREKAKRESDIVVKMLYKKLHDDSLTHSALIISAIKAIGESAPKPV
ncbi:hypothetical protein CW680_01440, partial [Candidatus Bathyarchaeota archaeon]